MSDSDDPLARSNSSDDDFDALIRSATRQGPDTAHRPARAVDGAQVVGDIRLRAPERALGLQLPRAEVAGDVVEPNARGPGPSRLILRAPRTEGELSSGSGPELEARNDSATASGRPTPRRRIRPEVATEDDGDEARRFVPREISRTAVARRRSPEQAQSLPEQRLQRFVEEQRRAAAGPRRAINADSVESARERVASDETSGSIPSRTHRRLEDSNTLPPAVRRRLNPTAPSSTSSREPAGSRSRREAVVDLTEDSDEDEVVLLDARPPAGRRVAFAGGIGEAQAAGERRRAQMQQDLQDLEARMEQRREHSRNLIRQERQRMQQLHEPPAPAPQIRFGGAVLQRGDQQIRYRPLAEGQPGAPIDIERRLALIPRLRPEPEPPAQVPAGNAVHNALLAGLGHAGQWFGVQRGGNIDPGILEHIFGLGRHPAHPPPPDVPAILAGIERPTHPDPLPGFTDNFDLDSLGPIVIDDHGNVVKAKKKPKLVCFVCHARLRLSASYRNEDDRVWSLRCGHMLDQRCLVQLSTPMTHQELDQPPVPVLGSVEKKGKKKKAKVQKEVPREYEWKCPAKGCGKAHRSVKMPGAEDWVQVAGAGAFQVFM